MNDIEAVLQPVGNAPLLPSYVQILIVKAGFYIRVP